MKQPAPIRGESMETLIIQTLSADRLADEDAPPLPDTRTEQHTTVSTPDGVRHSSDPNRYLINRNAQIGGHATTLNDLEADDYDNNETNESITSIVSWIEYIYGERSIPRTKLAVALQMLKDLCTKLVEDCQMSEDKLVTWAYVRGMKHAEWSEEKTPCDEADGMAPGDDDSKIPAALTGLLSLAERNLMASKKMLQVVEDVENGKYRSISDSMLAQGWVLELYFEEIRYDKNENMNLEQEMNEAEDREVL